MNMNLPSPDLLRRFTPTPLTADLCVMERTIRLETNSPVILEQTRRALTRYAQARSERPEFLWRVVSEPDTNSQQFWPEMPAFSDRGLSFINIGQRGFLAVDSEAREAAAFLPEDLIRDELGFKLPFLAMLFSLTAPALGLIPCSAACVQQDGKGLLIFGLPRSGKTTASYLASKLGLEFHADQVVFMDTSRQRLRAWGEFWPAVFHEESSQRFPALSSLGRPFRQGDQTGICLEKHQSRNHLPSGVVPISSLFMERNESEGIKFARIGHREVSQELRASLLLQEVERAQPEWAAVSAKLSYIPAYRLSYGTDPKVAAIFFHKILTRYSPFDA